MQRLRRLLRGGALPDRRARQRPPDGRLRGAVAGKAKDRRENEPGQPGARKTVPETMHVDCSLCPPGFPLPAGHASLEHFREMSKSRRDAAARKP